MILNVDGVNAGAWKRTGWNMDPLLRIVYTCIISEDYKYDIGSWKHGAINRGAPWWKWPLQRRMTKRQNSHECSQAVISFRGACGSSNTAPVPFIAGLHLLHHRFSFCKGSLSTQIHNVYHLYNHIGLVLQQVRTHVIQCNSFDLLEYIVCLFLKNKHGIVCLTSWHLQNRQIHK